MYNRKNDNNYNGVLMANIEPISPKEIKENGLLSYINDFIAIFNVCIVYDKETNTIFPAKIVIHESSDRRIWKLISYIKKNSRRGDQNEHRKFK